MPKRNKSATNIRADTMMNRLKPMNNASNGVVPEAAARPNRFTGMKRKPNASGSRCSRAARLAAVAPEGGTRRTAVVSPKRLDHIRPPAASDTKALGVVRYSSQ